MFRLYETDRIQSKFSVSGIAALFIEKAPKED